MTAYCGHQSTSGHILVSPRRGAFHYGTAPPLTYSRTYYNNECTVQRTELPPPPFPNLSTMNFD